MRKSRLPLPFLIMALGLALLLVKFLEDKTVHARAHDSTTVTTNQPVQSVEQQKVAAVYFRIMSWLSAIAPKNPQPARPQVNDPAAVSVDPSNGGPRNVGPEKNDLRIAPASSRLAFCALGPRESTDSTPRDTRVP